MLLTMDVGNSNLKIGFWQEDRLVFNWSVHTRPELSGDELGLMIGNFLRLEYRDFSIIEDIIIASVVPPMRPALERFSNKYLGKFPIFVEGWSQKMMHIDYLNPREVGADRVVVSIAAWRRFQTNLVIIDFGTATTFDCVSQEGNYLGGAIAPGFRLSAETLFQKASLLPKMESFYKPTKAICKDTLNGLNSGLVLGYTALVEGLVERIEAEMPQKPKVVATGGLAALFASLTSIIEEVLPNLTMEGLKIIYEEKKW
ncbi:MAG: type III pantothenate kinase [Deltaproteobacteria bacterium]|nr:type III pantothenate kinase [Deltaproteobacteria bacterium]